MKIALLSLFLFLLSFSTSAFVVDTDGDLLRNGGSYYILPVFRGKGGGVGLAKTGNETCPLTVAQSKSELSKGLPVRISSPLRTAFIKEGFILILQFTAVPTCAPTPSFWTVVEGLSAQQSVKITENMSGWFAIDKYQGDAYKLVFLSHSGDGDTTREDIGIYIDDDGIGRLVVTDEQENASGVVFQKATASSASAI